MAISGQPGGHVGVLQLAASSSASSEFTQTQAGLLRCPRSRSYRSPSIGGQFNPAWMGRAVHGLFFLAGSDDPSPLVPPDHF